MSDFDLAWHGREFFHLATKETVRAMTKAAIVVENRAKKIMGSGASRMDSKRATGMIKKGKKSVMGYHRPSAPGFPPNIDTGVLKSSIGHRVKVRGMSVNGFVGSDTDKVKAKAEAGTDVEYGYYLEVGAPKINLKPRPWLRPALRASEKEILTVLRGGVVELKGRPDFSQYVGPTNQ